MTQQLSPLIAHDLYEKELNRLLANLQVYRQKLLHYHWFSHARNLRDVQQLLSFLHFPMQVMIDDLMDELLGTGAKPLTSLQQFVQQAELKEGRSFFDCKSVVNQLNKDLHTLAQNVHRSLLIAIEKKHTTGKEILRAITKILYEDQVALQQF